MDCQQRIKYAYQIRQQILDAFDIPVTEDTTVEVYEIIADGADIKCIKADPNAEEYSDNEGMVEYTEVDENFELNYEGSDEDDIDKRVAKDDPLDAVSFLLEKKDLFIEEKGDNNSAHKRQRTHVCEVCEKSFMRKSNLVDHLRLHANVRLFKCEYCEKEFVQAGNYRSHLRVRYIFLAFPPLLEWGKKACFGKIQRFFEEKDLLEAKDLPEAQNFPASGKSEEK